MAMLVFHSQSLINLAQTPEGMNIYNFADVSNYVVTEGDSIMLRGGNSAIQWID